MFVKLFRIRAPLFISLFSVPVYLPADTANDADFFRSELYSGAEMTEFIHPVVRIFRIDITYFYEDVFQLFVHTVEFMPLRKPRGELGSFFHAGLKKLIAHNHYGLCQIQ